MPESTMQDLVRAILAGDTAASVSCAAELGHAGASAEDLVRQGVETAMSALDAKCTLEHFNLLEIMLAGRAVMEVMKRLYPAGAVPESTKGKVLVASLEGDVHDLGKNILRMVLTGKGYHVVDGGKDCPLLRLVELAGRELPLAVGVSGLITPVIPLVRQVREQLRQRGLGWVKVMAGGAALKQCSPSQLQVDFVGESAFSCLHFLEGIERDGQRSGRYPVEGGGR